MLAHCVIVYLIRHHLTELDQCGTVYAGMKAVSCHSIVLCPSVCFYHQRLYLHNSVCDGAVCYRHHVQRLLQAELSHSLVSNR
jgi:hypothetical protein